LVIAALRDSTGKKWIETAGLVKLVKLAAPAYMSRADEDLRNRGAAIGTRDHLGTPLGVARHVDFGECAPLAPEQSLG
jgi:hypothetical protein